MFRRFNEKEILKTARDRIKRELSNLEEQREKLLDEISILRLRAQKENKKDLVKELDKLTEELRSS